MPLSVDKQASGPKAVAEGVEPRNTEHGKADAIVRAECNILEVATARRQGAPGSEALARLTQL